MLNRSEKKSLLWVLIFLGLGGSIRAYRETRVHWGHFTQPMSPSPMLTDSVTPKPRSTGIDSIPKLPANSVVTATLPPEIQTLELEKPSLEVTPPEKHGKRGGVSDKSRVKVDVNHASLAELALLPGIGPKMAMVLMEWRKTHGVFLKPDDLLLVKGIGQKKLDRLRPHLILSAMPLSEPASPRHSRVGQKTEDSIIHP